MSEALRWYPLQPRKLLTLPATAFAASGGGDDNRSSGIALAAAAAAAADAVAAVAVVLAVAATRAASSSRRSGDGPRDCGGVGGCGGGEWRHYHLDFSLPIICPVTPIVLFLHSMLTVTGMVSCKSPNMLHLQGHE